MSRRPTSSGEVPDGQSPNSDPVLVAGSLRGRPSPPVLELAAKVDTSMATTLTLFIAGGLYRNDIPDRARNDRAPARNRHPPSANPALRMSTQRAARETAR